MRHYFTTREACVIPTHTCGIIGAGRDGATAPATQGEIAAIRPFQSSNVQHGGAIQNALTAAGGSGRRPAVGA